MDPDVLKQLEESIRELNEALSKQRIAFEDQTTNIINSGNAINNNTSATNSASTASNNAASGTSRYSQTVSQVDAELAKSNANFGKALNSGKEGLKSFGSALISAETSLTKYGDSARQLGGAAFALGSNFGLLGAAIGGILGGLGLAASQILQLNQNVIDVRDGFAKQSGILPITTSELTDLASQAGYSLNDMQKLSKVTNGLGESLLGLGGYAGEGAVRFMRIADVGEETFKRFSRLGVSQETLLEYQGYYVELQRAAGQSQANRRKTDQQIQRESLEYAENLLLISSLTGEQATTLKEREQQQLLAYEEQAAVLQERAEIARLRQMAEGGDAEAGRMADAKQAELDDRQEVMRLLTNTLGDAEAYAVGSVMRLNGYNDKTAQYTQIQLQQIVQEYQRSAKTAEDQRKLRDRIAEAQAGRISEFNTQIQYAGENAQELVTASNQTTQNINALGTDIVSSAARVQESMATKGEEGTDPLSDNIASLQELERDAKRTFQEFLLTFDPFRNGIEALGTAALAATGLLAGGALIGKLAQTIFGRAGDLGSARNPMYAKLVEGPTTGGFLNRLFNRTAAPAGATPTADTGRRSIGSRLRGLFTRTAAPAAAATGVTGAATNVVGALGGTSTARNAGALTQVAGSPGGSRVGIFLMGLSKGLSAIGKVAPQFLLGAGAVSAAIAIIGAGIAGATWILGKTMPTLAKGLTAFDTVDGDNLKKVGTGMAGLGAGILAMGASGITEAMGNIAEWATSKIFGSGPQEDPMVKLGNELVKFQSFEVDPEKIEKNSKAVVAFSTMVAQTSALQGLGAVTSAISGAIAGFFNVELPLAKFKSFSDLDINDEQVAKNATAFKLFSEAMSSYKGYGSLSALGIITQTLGGAVLSFYNSLPTENPINRFEKFSKLDIDGDKTRVNANAFKDFANALAQYKGGPGVMEALSQLAGGAMMTLFGNDGPIESFRKFSNEDFGPNMERNAEAFAKYATAATSGRGPGGGAAGGTGGGGGGGGGGAPATETSTETSAPAAAPSAAPAAAPATESQPPQTVGQGPISRGLAAMRAAATSSGSTTAAPRGNDSNTTNAGPVPSVTASRDEVLRYTSSMNPTQRAEFYRSLAGQGMQRAGAARQAGNNAQALLWERAANSYTLAASIAESSAQTSQTGGFWNTSGSGYAYPVPDGVDTSQYGFRIHPVRGGRRFHTGLDIGKGRGAPIIAANDGRIVRTSNDTSPYRGFGQIAIQDHGDGLQSVYAHLDSYTVREGDYVNKGREIGKMGSTGMSTGPHLHYILQRAGGFAAPSRANTIDPKTKISGRATERAEKGGVFAGFPSVFTEGMADAEKIGTLNPQSLIAKLGKTSVEEVNTVTPEEVVDNTETDLTPDLIGILESKLERVLLALENNQDTHDKILKNSM